MKAVTVRFERLEDEAFLFDLYASTRREELDAWGWPLEVRNAFLNQQLQASRGVYQSFPDAEFQIVLVNGVNAGRIAVHRTREELYLVDLTLLPQYRNAGIGTALLQRVFGEAAATKKPVRLNVFKGNRAETFYRKLGFSKTGESELYLEMVWQAPDVVATAPVLPDAVKLPFQFDATALHADFAKVVPAEFVPHFNTAYYEGDWSAVSLRSVGGQAGHIYPDPTAKNAFADTPLLERCGYIREVLDTLRCPTQAVRFLRLKAGSVIKEHRDHELGFEDGEVRLHIPVITNPDVEFILSGARVVMGEGECWYLNVNQPHRVANRGIADRIHLVIDCVVNDWLREQLLSAAGKPEKGG